LPEPRLVMDWTARNEKRIWIAYCARRERFIYAKLSAGVP
jgi:hypothetical protein